MKKFFQLIFCSFLLFNLSAQDLIVKQDGKVGIGTTTPLRNLEISGDNSQFLRITSTNQFPAFLELIRNNDGGGAASDWRFVNSGNLDLEYATDDFSMFSNKIMSINGASKRIAFGYLTPFTASAKIDVEDPSWQFRLWNNDPGGDDWWVGSTSDNWNIGRKKFVISPTNSSLNAALVIDSAKFVGVGTIDPKTRLHIVGLSDASYTNHGHLVIGSIGSTNIVFDNNEILARNNENESPLYIQRDGGSLLLCGNEQGQVGIGVASESGLPDSTYLLAVDGKILTEELRIQNSGNWPDYVFSDDYKLEDLKELENKIQLFHHLPGVPSAEEILNNGQMVGEMQKVLLEKIEELTLYTIQQQKQIDALISKVENQEELLMTKGKENE